MGRQYKQLYKIKRTKEFIRKTSELRKIYRRMPDLIKAIDWALARKPHAFTKLTSDFYLWKTVELENNEFPIVNILYRIVEEAYEVILIDIDDIPPE
jgi:hypothetical protein